MPFEFKEGVTMAVLKNKTQGNYTIVSQNIMHDKDLSLTERGMLLTLLSLPDNWHLTIMGLCQILPDGKDRISRTLNSLIDKGYVTREQSRGEKGMFNSTDLEVHETPIKPTTPPRHPKKTKETPGVSPYSENPNAVNSDADSPSPDNQPQSNTYISNNQTVNIHRVSTADTLTDTEYEKLVSEFGKAAVDYQLQRISDHGYKGCNNYETINAWCKERANRPVGNPPSFQKKNSFHNFEERQYPDDYWQNLELKLLSS